MATSINLTNVEVLSYSHELATVGLYQYGRTVDLSLTAFILPTDESSEASKFSSIDTQEAGHIAELLDDGWADSITLGSGDNAETISNVKIMGYSFPKDYSKNNKINLSRVNMALRYTETFDNRQALTDADGEVYKNLEAFDYADYIQGLSENYSFSLSDTGEFSLNQNINLELINKTSTPEDLTQKAKDLIKSVFLSSPPKLGYLDSRYDNFIQAIKTRGNFTESYDSIKKVYAFSRSVNTKSGAYKNEQKSEKWSAGLKYSIQTDSSGIVTITETADIKGRLGLDESESSEDLYSNAFEGFVSLKSGSYQRCQDLMSTMIKEKSDWIEGSESWGLADDLKTKFVSFGKNLNRIAGAISYNIAYTNNPKMNEEAMFDYSLSSSRGNNGIVRVSETGSITPYDKNKNSDFDLSAKALYDRFTSPSDVLSRAKVLHDSIKDADAITLEHPRNLVSSNVSFPAYGVSIKYGFTYSDDKSLRNDTYIRKLEKKESYSSPVKIRSSVIAPNIKQTNYDSNQTSVGSKDVSFNCIFKRNPDSNLINKSHADYLKTSSASLFNEIKSEVEKSAFVNAKQSVSNQLSFFLRSLNYSFDSEYTFTSSAKIGFIDRRGLAAGVLEY